MKDSIDVFKKPRNPILANKQICDGQKLSMLTCPNGSNNLQWQVYGIKGQQNPENPREYILDQDVALEVKDYKIVLVDQDPKTKCYSDFVENYLSVKPAAKTEIIGDTMVCAYELEKAYVTPYAPGSFYQWTITGNKLNYTKDEKGNVRYIDWDVPGYDTIVLYESTVDFCEGFATLIVRTAPYPEASFEYSIPGASNKIWLTDLTIQDSIWDINPDGELISEIITYDQYWNLGITGLGKNEFDTVVLYKNIPEDKVMRKEGYKYGDYEITFQTINNYGCASEYKEIIFVDLQANLWVPNAFAPENPAMGVRTFQPKGFNIDKMEIWVYDNWGNLVWYSNDVKDGNFVGSWDGKYNGQLLKADAYVWKIEASFLDGQKWEGEREEAGTKSSIFGSVYLIR